ncbi:MAG TPA: SDR family oxidoreductase [Candidatus Sulfotelmatobacter sp.]|jgi:3-oxoacyl-[acyl-carrier protein] reductase
MANEIILVTGASSDIGCALIPRLLAVEHPPVILAHAHQSGDRFQSLQSRFGDRLQTLRADLSQSAQVTAMAEDIAARFGTPTKIVHLPALRLIYDRLTKFNWERFQQDLAIQVQSAIILLQRFAPKMSKLPRAKVVFVSSSVTLGMPPKFMSMYTVAKYAQLGLMRSAAAEYAGTGLNINAISPGMIETRFVSDIAEVAVQMSAAANPKGRNATPDDILGAIEFLLSPASDYMTGIDIPLTAGSTC